MSLSGRLEDLQLRDLLQILGLSRNSGLLQLSCAESQAELLFSEGLVVSALDAGAEGGHKDQFSNQLEGMALRRHAIISLVRDLMCWDSGDFSFKACQVSEAIHHAACGEHVCLDRGLGLEELLGEEPVALPDPEQPPLEPTLDDVQMNTFKADVVAPVVAPAAVLLVDNDPELAERLVQALAEKGLSARSFNCGKTLLDAARSAWQDGHSPLLIIDLILPRMHGGGILGGLELVEQVRSLRDDQLCMVYSDYPCPEVEQRLQQLGVTELLSKPIPQKSDSADDLSAINEFCAAVAKQTAALLGVSSPCVEKPTPKESLCAASFVESPPQSEYGTDPCHAGMGVLKGMLQELQAAECEEQIMLLVLRFASEILGRAVLFSVGKDHVVGLGQFGYGSAEVSADEKVRKIKLPLAEPSSFSEIVERPGARYGSLGEGYWDTYLRRELGIDSTDEVFIGPLICDGRVLAFLCGDNQNARQGLADNYALEIFLQQAGIVLENLQMRGQMRDLSELLGKTFDR